MVTTASKDVVRTINLTDSEVRFYQEEGYLTIPSLIEPALIDPLIEEVFSVLDANGVPRASLAKATSTADKLRQNDQYLAGSLLDGLINSPAGLKLASRLVGGPAYRYLPFTAVKAGGGGGAFHFHQDNNYTRHDPAVGSMNLWVALVDMTPENGCLQIVPRSHHQGQATSRPSDDSDGHQQIDIAPLAALPIRMHAGDAVAFTRWTVHGSGPNTTDQPRVAYALQYHRDDVRWLDKQTGQWQKLLDNPRFPNQRVTALGPQK